jgi:membrane-bound serine protease (ClpP class)
MMIFVRSALRVLAATALLLALTPCPASAAGHAVVVATLDGVIDPITADYVQRTLAQAHTSGAEAVVIQLDTPGGLDTSMRSIIKDMLAAPMPVVVYVSPSGARAASAGFFITEAADLAAMAPGTNIGSAHPVSLVGSNPAPSPGASPATPNDIEDIKVLNDAVAYVRALATLHHHNADWAAQAVSQSANVTAEDAVRLKVVDLESGSLQALLGQLDGRTFAKNGQAYTLNTRGVAVQQVTMGPFDEVLEALVNPDVAYLLFLLALVGIGFWVTHPGLALPGVVGVIAAVMASLVLYNLPVNLAGILLILAAIVVFVVDLKAPTHGVLTTGGVIAMSLGSLLLINTGFLDQGVNIVLVIATVLLVALAFAVVLRKVIAIRRRPFGAGEEAMLGRVGTTRERLDPNGLVFVDGALWQASSLSGPLDRDRPVRVVGIDGLRLRVEAFIPQRASEETTSATS